MTTKSFSTSGTTTDDSLGAYLTEISIPSGNTALVTMECFGVAASGKRICGTLKGVYTNDGMGALVILGTVQEIAPIQRDADFADADFEIDASTGTDIKFAVTGQALEGITKWDVNVTYSITQ